MASLPGTVYKLPTHTRKQETGVEITRFGKTGMKVSKLCLGCMTYGSTQWREWVLEEEASRPFIKQALERGINFFDTADVYSQGVSEEIVGRALKDYAVRHEVVIATKVHGVMGKSANAGGLSRKHILEAIEHSLKRLGTDYVDLYQIHRFDPNTPMEETLEALNDVVRAGKALYVGISSYNAQRTREAAAILRRLGTPCVIHQPSYSMVNRWIERDGLLETLDEEGIGCIGFCDSETATCKPCYLLLAAIPRILGVVNLVGS